MHVCANIEGLYPHVREDAEVDDVQGGPGNHGGVAGGVKGAVEGARGGHDTGGMSGLHCHTNTFTSRHARKRMLESSWCFCNTCSSRSLRTISRQAL